MSDDDGDATGLVQEVILAALVKTWDAHPAEPVPDGDRVFTRYIVRTGEGRGWRDWFLAGVIRPDGAIEWLGPVGDAEGEIQADLDLDADQGRVVSDDGNVVIWWVRSALDGPDEPRVSEWAQDLDDDEPWKPQEA